MKIRSAITISPLTLGLSVLMLGGTVAAVSAGASAREQSLAEKQGRIEAASAQRSLSNGKYDAAILHAELAVSDQPHAAAYRMILGQSYLKAGRFASARDAFADVLTLDDGNGKAALHYALTQIATGDWAGARKTLDAHATTIAVSDRGLAIALAGDPVGAVELLGTAARVPGADAKVRQNYALSLALAGRWREAQTVVAMDVAPGDVAKRILDWSTFSRPKSASDQVAALLGVTPAVDPGQPVALALNAPARQSATALAQAEPQVQPAIDSYMPGNGAAQPSPAPVGVQPNMAGVVFAKRSEVVQALPVSVAAVAPKRGAVTAPVLAKFMREVPPRYVVGRAATKGNFVVQLGAYDNAGVARDAWGRVGRRYATFSGRTPQGMSITRGGKSFYRLSVGGFARGDAVTLCESYRAKGGACFVRAGAGDQVAMWAKGQELASR